MILSGYLSRQTQDSLFPDICPFKLCPDKLKVQYVQVFVSLKSGLILLVDEELFHPTKDTTVEYPAIVIGQPPLGFQTTMCHTSPIPVVMVEG